MSRNPERRSGPPSHERAEGSIGGSPTVRISNNSRANSSMYDHHIYRNRNNSNDTRSRIGDGAESRDSRERSRYSPSGSRVSISSSKRIDLEIHAARRRHEIQVRLIEEKARLATELVDQELAANLADEEENEDLRSFITRRSILRKRDEMRVGQNVENWLQNQTHEQHVREPPAPIVDINTDITHRLLRRVVVNKGLPTFQGDVLEWPCFKRAFEETTRRGEFSDEENITRLYESLKGEAKEAVASLMVTSRSAKQVMELLELRFGNPNAIATRIVEDIKSLPKIFNNNGDLVPFATRVKNCVAALEAANHIGYLHSHDLMEEITQKIPYAMVYNYNRYLNDQRNSNEPVLVTLSNFLFFEAEIACRAGTFNSNTGSSQKRRDRYTSANKRPSATQGTFHTFNNDTDSETPTKKKKKENCAYCDQDSHVTTKCEQYLNLSVPDR